MAPESSSPGRHTDVGDRPCPGDPVAAVCDLPSATHSRAKVTSGTPGEIVRTPAYFCTTYSIKFQVNGKDITLHGINRHEFRLIGQESSFVVPGYPPANRYPQPRRLVDPQSSQEGLQA